MANLSEIWVPIPEYEGLYEISSLGRGKSLSRPGYRRKEPKIINPSTDRYGYLYTSLTKSGVGVHSKMHRLVALAFIPNTENKPSVNHKNGIKTDNRLENLEWATYSEQRIHAIRILYVKNYKLSTDVGLGKNPNAKPVIQLTLNGEYIKRYACCAIATKELNASRSVIPGAARRKGAKCCGFRWIYESDYLKKQA